MFRVGARDNYHFGVSDADRIDTGGSVLLVRPESLSQPTTFQRFAGVHGPTPVP